MLKNFYYLVGTAVFALLLFASCTSDDSSFPVGEDWINSDTRVLYIDTLSVESSTFMFDSLQVSNTDRLLLGSYQDSVFGYTKSKIFAQLVNSEYTIDDDAVFDSIALILKYDNYFYNDTLAQQRLKIYALTQDIVPEDDDYFYNTSAFEHGDETIGEVGFMPRPKGEDSLYLPLKAAFGQQLFDKLKDNDINNSDEFLSQYPGILIEPDAGNTTILGFQPTSLVRLYYSIDTETEEDEQVIDFDFNTSNTFHSTASDRSTTYFKEIVDQEDLVLAEDAGGYSYLQSGTGLATRIAFPHLAGLNSIEGTGTLLNAQLEISLNTDQLSDDLHVGDSLSAYIIDQRNNILNTLYDYSGDSAYGVITESGDEFPVLTYSMPIHYFLDQKMTNNNGENWYLALISSNFNKTVDRYIFNGNKASKDVKLKIKLIYAIYDN